MSDTSVVRARIDPALKAQASAVLHDMGLTPSDAIRLLFHNIVAEKSLPFMVKAPNAETRAAMKDLQHGNDLKSFTSTKEMRDFILNEEDDG